MEIDKIVTAAAEPINKLIDAVSGAIGKAYEPRHIRKMADAKAYELRVIGEELRNNADLPIVYSTNNGISVDISDYESLAKRTGRRLAYQEMARQENIESIVGSTYDLLQNEHKLVEGEVSREWMNRFIDAAGDISTEDLQLLWSKVLAGEIMEPSSFSLRTLECLRNIDVNDARLFEKLCKIVVSNRLVVNDKEFLEKHGISYSQILKLDECGLINSSGTISVTVKVANKLGLIFDFGDYVLMAKSDNQVTFMIEAHPLTAAGIELYATIGDNIDFDTIKEICTIAKKRNSNLDLSLHKVNHRNPNGFDYANVPIPFEEWYCDKP